MRKVLMRKAFTLIELVVAIALLTMAMSFSGVIFKIAINARRTSTATAEIMRNLRALTSQLDSDFKGLQKDGWLILYSEEMGNKKEFDNSVLGTFQADRLYYFSTGDFQSWFPPYVRSNIARVYFGHEWNSLYDNSIVVSKWSLARDIRLLTPGIASTDDSNDVSYAVCKADLRSFENPYDALYTPVTINKADTDSFRNLLCQNVGQIVIEWTGGNEYLNSDNSLAWYGLSNSKTDWAFQNGVPLDPAYTTIEDITNLPVSYSAEWAPFTPRQYWPKAVKFTFTLYDSKDVIKNGRTFTHIVYIGD